ncbi:NleF caspase inhibitor [Providencia alcalifaciens]|nr:NleF caspase inhibitor [Providencia alcalifaciens]
MFPSNISNRNIDLTSWMYVANSDTPTANDESLSPTVSALNANHFPTPSQEELISVLVTAYSTSQNIEERESICCKLKELRDELIQQRENIFEFVHEGTDDVFGILREGKTANDRDEYIRKLMTFHAIGEKIKQVREGGDYKNVELTSF